MLGFIFWPKSKRYVQMISAHAGIIPDYSEERLRRHSGAIEQPEAIGRQPKRVGVFVDDMPQNIITRVYNYRLDYIQLHGNEPRTTCENLRRTIDPDIHAGIKIIKAISIATADDLKRCEEYYGAVDLFLFDTKCEGVGGSGRHFNWQLLDAYDGDVPFLLSGGIGPEDVNTISQFSHPRFIGVDVNSRFETSPGVKDVALLRAFVNSLRSSE